MTSTHVKSDGLKRSESKKSHPWWWDSHISPKNSKWLQDNLEEMDLHVKRMLKLVEEDADSFAKKAEIYFKKRPELISLVEEFYRIYRSLAERYDNLTGELRKNMPSDIQSQSSDISDAGSEPQSTVPSPEQIRPNRNKSGPRAAGFDFFLGRGSNVSKKGDDESSNMDSESESDDSSVNSSSNVDEQVLQKKIIELEAELRIVKENYEHCKKSNYEEELLVTNEKLRLSEEEIARLTIEVQKYKSVEDSNFRLCEAKVLESNDKIRALEEELRVTQEKLNKSDEEVARLRHEFSSKGSSIKTLKDKLKSAEKQVSVFIMVKRELSKLLSDRKGTRYDGNHSKSNRDQDIRGLKEILVL